MSPTLVLRGLIVLGCGCQLGGFGAVVVVLFEVWAPGRMDSGLGRADWTRYWMGGFASKNTTNNVLHTLNY
jgi:hypothetical protein